MGTDTPGFVDLVLIDSGKHLIVLPVLLLLRRLGERADVIVGKAGRWSPCAGGLSVVTAVDTAARQPVPAA